MADTQAYVVADIKSSGGTDDGQYATVTYALRDGEEIVLAFPISMIGHYLAIVEGAAKRTIDAAATRKDISLSSSSSIKPPRDRTNMSALHAKQIFSLESAATRQLSKRADLAALGLTANPFSLLRASVAWAISGASARS